MRTTRSIVLSMLLVQAVGAMGLARPALAIEDPGGENVEGSRFGVGAETSLVAPFAPNVVLTPFAPGASVAASFDTGHFRVDGLLYLLFVENNQTAFSLGGRFFYVLHRAKSADFSIGGGVSLGVYDPHNPLGGSQFHMGFDFATQIRAFLTSNVALTGTIGLGFVVGDRPFIFGIGGQLIGSLGLIYYFQ